MSEPGVLSLSIVVVGAARSGKSTLVRGLHERLGDPSHLAAPPASVAAPLDWVRIDLGRIGGREAAVSLFAVPGITPYDGTRRLLLQHADGAIFLADAQAARLEDNADAMRVLREHLPAGVPVVAFYSKQDLPAELLLPAPSLDHALGVGAADRHVGSALLGDGVREMLQAILTAALRRRSTADE